MNKQAVTILITVLVTLVLADKLRTLPGVSMLPTA